MNWDAIHGYAAMLVAATLLVVVLVIVVDSIVHWIS
jgi:hypothetical protein